MESRRITTVSRVTHAPLVMVHTNVLLPKARLLTPLFAVVGAVIVAVPVVVHKPVPGVGLLPASVAVERLQIA